VAATLGWAAILAVVVFPATPTADFSGSVLTRIFKVRLLPEDPPVIHRVREEVGAVVVTESGALGNESKAMVLPSAILAGKFVIIALLLYLLGCWHQTRRYLFLYWLSHRISPPGSRAISLLPSQERIVDDLIDLASHMRREATGRLVGLSGDHGTGKSYLLEAFRQRLEASKDIAVVPVNIWENQREIDLHFAVAKQVFSHPKVLDRCVDVYPARLVLMPPLMGLTYLLPKGFRFNLGASQSDLLDSNASVPMVWQDIFRRIVGRAKQKNLTIVVVLEEIDRADPPIAQVAITLARRALDLPGVLTILPYVEAQMRHKVFNPMTVATPDLRGTMESILHDRYPGRGEKSKPIEMPDDQQRRHRATANALYLRPPGVVTAEQVELQRYWLYQDFSEKYLRTSKRLSGLAADEVVAFIASSFVTSRVWARLSEGADREVLGRMISSRIDVLMGQFRFAADDLRRSFDFRPNLRAFESEVAILTELVRRHPGDGPTSAVCHAEAAATAVLAYVIAAIDQQLPKDGPVLWDSSRSAWRVLADEIRNDCAVALAAPVVDRRADFGEWFADRIDPKASPLPPRFASH
jgi:hypothetical protein